MITFTTALVLLVLGYVVYGAFVERVFGADASRKTPCYTMADGVDYTPMPTWKVYLIQFLNIAGTGPIFWVSFTGRRLICGLCSDAYSAGRYTTTCPA